jgi:hypothetical protein
MCFAPANPQKETLIRRLITGGATAWWLADETAYV